MDWGTINIILWVAFIGYLNVKVYNLCILLTLTTLVTSSKHRQLAPPTTLVTVHVLRLPQHNYWQYSYQLNIRNRFNYNYNTYQQTYHIHTHGNFNFTYPSGADTSGGVLAFEGDPEDNVYQDQD